MRRQSWTFGIICSRRPHTCKTGHFTSSKERERLQNVKKWKMHVQSVQKYCFSSSNMQICGVLVAVVVVAQAPYETKRQLGSDTSVMNKKKQFFYTFTYLCKHCFIRQWNDNFSALNSIQLNFLKAENTLPKISSLFFHGILLFLCHCLIQVNWWPFLAQLTIKT